MRLPKYDISRTRSRSVAVCSKTYKIMIIYILIWWNRSRGPSKRGLIELLRASKASPQMQHLSSEARTTTRQRCSLASRVILTNWTSSGLHAVIDCAYAVEKDCPEDRPESPRPCCTIWWSAEEYHHQGLAECRQVPWIVSSEKLWNAAIWFAKRARVSLWCWHDVDLVQTLFEGLKFFLSPRRYNVILERLRGTWYTC